MITMNYPNVSIETQVDEWICTSTGCFKKRGKKKLADFLHNYVRDAFRILEQYYRFRLSIDATMVEIIFDDSIKKRRIRKPVHRGIDYVGYILESELEEDLDSDSRDDLFEAEEVDFIRLGEFRKERPKKIGIIGTIVLYNKAIAMVSNNKDQYVTLLWATLMHETFHAFHYGLLKAKGKETRWNYVTSRSNGEIVTESLASAFEYHCLSSINPCQNRIEATNLESHLRKTWLKYDVEDWPYSGALGIVKSSKPVELFYKLLDISLYDWKTAADIITTRYYLTEPKICSILNCNIK